MKLLHTSDWHLGRMTYNKPRAEDHDAVIAEILEIARGQKPDLIVHTGDLFDVLRPAYADIERGLNALRELAALAPVVVVCGNHDSPALFRIFASLLGKESRITFVDVARPPADGGILDYQSAAGERIRLAPLPFIHPNRLVDLFKPEGWNAEYADRVQEIESILAAGLLAGYDSSHDVLLFAAHLHVGGASYSGSERQITVGDAYATRAEHVPAVSYAAFGHIHKPQDLRGPVAGRYAGSPIQLDFGEEGEAKYVVLVEAVPGRPAEIVPVELTTGRQLKRITGTIDEIRLQAERIGTALCLITVNSDRPIPDLSRQVRDLLPDATVLDVFEVSSQPSVTVVTGGAVENQTEPTMPELFAEYIGGLKIPGNQRTQDVFRQLLQSVEEMTLARFPEEDALLGTSAGPEAP